MNNEHLDQNIVELKIDITKYRGQCEFWWRYNQRRKAALIGVSVLSSLGATLAGIFGYPHTAASFAAVGGAVIGLQGGFKVGEKAYKYGKAMTECDRLLGKLKFQVKAAPDFDGVFDAFNQLREQEGTEDSPVATKT